MVGQPVLQRPRRPSDSLSACGLEPRLQTVDPPPRLLAHQRLHAGYLRLAWGPLSCPAPRKPEEPACEAPRALVGPPHLDSAERAPTVCTAGYVTPTVDGRLDFTVGAPGFKSPPTLGMDGGL